jgi:hypothetical protein
LRKDQWRHFHTFGIQESIQRKGLTWGEWGSEDRLPPPRGEPLPTEQVYPGKPEASTALACFLAVVEFHCNAISGITLRHFSFVSFDAVTAIIPSALTP